MVLVAVMMAAVGAAVPEGGPGPGALELLVAVDSYPLGPGPGPTVRVGGPVMVSYRLSNHGEATVTGVRINDTLVPPSSLHCPGDGADRVARLAPLTSVTCTAVLLADPDRQTGAVLAQGTLSYGGAQLRRTGHSGYVGVGGRLALAVSPQVSPSLVPQGHQATALVRYTLTNTGNRPVLGVALADPALEPQRIDCGADASVPVLAPGATAQCRAVVRRLPGSYRSAGQAIGSDRLVTVGTDGGHLSPTRLTARAVAGFTIGVLPAAPPPSPPPPPPPAPSPIPAPVHAPVSVRAQIPIPVLIHVPGPTVSGNGPVALSPPLTLRTAGTAAATPPAISAPAAGPGLAAGAVARPAPGGVVTPGPARAGARAGATGPSVGRAGPPLSAAQPPKAPAPLLHAGHSGGPGGVLRRYALIMFLLLMLPAAAAAATLGLRRRSR